MLSQHERQTLAEMERHLRENDPELARLLADPHAPAPPRAGWIRRAVSRANLWLLIAGLVLLTAGVVTKSADLALLAVIALVTAQGCMVTRAIRGRRRDD